MKRRFLLVDESDEVIQAFKSGRTPSASLLDVDVVNDNVSVVVFGIVHHRISFCWIISKFQHSPS